MPGAFLDMARRTPERSALRHHGREVSYQRLAVLARNVAEQLLVQQLRPGSVVAIHGHSCVGVVAAVFGVWQAAGVILPIDARMPRMRKELLVRQSGAAHLIIVDSASDDLPCRAPANVITVRSEDGSVIAAAGPEHDGNADPPPCAAPDSEPAPQSPAYIFFTSGTTGTPKGVLGCHGSLFRVIDWQRREFGVDINDRVAQLIRLSFDIVLQDLCLPLCAGATLVLPGTNRDASGVTVLRWLAENAVTLLHSVPTLMRSWLTDVRPDVDLRSLRAAFFVGEPLTGELVRRFRAMLRDDCVVVNLYGPTETTLIQFLYRVPNNPNPGVQSLGLPLPGSQAFITGPDGGPCPPGTQGEICIDTRHGTLGYINAFREQASRFIPNPFPQCLSPRLYRTGDLGWLAEDGKLYIAGRIDHQLKINGVRVEPDEIAAILAQHPRVRAAAVVVDRNQSGGRKILTAYWVAEDRADPRAVGDNLRHFLEERLMPVMVPGRFVRVAHLPYDPNGKLDRTALPRLRSLDEQPRTAPREVQTPVEIQLAEIWRRVLGCRPVSVNESFFALGGTSLSVVEMIALVRRGMQSEIPLQAFLETPTIAGLAEQVARAASGERFSIPMYPRRDSYPLSPAQRCYRAVCMPGGDNSSGCNLMARLEISGPLVPRDVTRALSLIMKRHDSLRSFFRETGGELRQCFVDTGELPIEVEHCFGLSAEDQERKVEEICRRMIASAIPPAEWPLFRVKIVSRSNTSHVVVLVSHHLIMDGYSLHLIPAELATIITAGRQRQPPALEPVRARYRDFSQWQEQQRRTEAFDAARTYWQTKLDGPIRDTFFPPHRALRRLGDRSWGYLHLLSDNMAEAVREMSRERDCSAFAVLLTTYLLAVAEELRRADIAVSIPLLGRPHPVLMNVLGNFATLGLIHQRLLPTTTAEELLDSVAEDLLAMQVHALYQYDDLLGYLAASLDQERFPLTSVMFNQEHSVESIASLIQKSAGVHRDLGRDIRFDLQGLVLQDSERMVIDFIYRQGALTPDRVIALVWRFDELLSAVLEKSSSPLDQLISGIWND